MTTNPKILELIAAAKLLARPLICHFEASDNCHLDSYIFPGEKQATIGWGHALSLSVHPCHWTQAQCDKQLDDDMQARINAILALVPETVLLLMTAGQFAMLISWSYNAVGAWKTSESFKKLKHGDITGWIKGADDWIKGADPKHPGKLVALPGLVRRRASEEHIAVRGNPKEVIALNWYMDLIDDVEHKPIGDLCWNKDKTRLFWAA